MTDDDTFLACMAEALDAADAEAQFDADMAAIDGRTITPMDWEQVWADRAAVNAIARLA